MLVEKIASVMEPIKWEIIFVDDNSKDGTIEEVRKLASQDGRVRGIRRIGRHGLSSACIEGILSSSAPYVAVMDADLQHDEKLLPQMYEKLDKDGQELVVASRYIHSNSMENWSRRRRILSRLATITGRFVTPIDLSDPMSGFFALRRDLFEKHVGRLSGVGFKILFDLCASFKDPVRFCDLPYTFGARLHGQSKMSGQIAWDYLLTIGHKIFGHAFPIKFLSFSLVGAVGAIINIVVLYILLTNTDNFASSYTASTIIAMISNFWMNNALTFRDVRLKRSELIRGMFSFFVACGIGALISIALATYLYESHGAIWYIAASAGIVVAAVWNYATNSFYTWRS